MNLLPISWNRQGIEHLTWTSSIMWAHIFTEDLYFIEFELIKSTWGQKYPFGHPGEQRTCTGQLLKGSAFSTWGDGMITVLWFDDQWLMTITSAVSCCLQESYQTEPGISSNMTKSLLPWDEARSISKKRLSLDQGCDGIYFTDWVGKQSSSGLGALLNTVSCGSRSR